VDLGIVNIAADSDGVTYSGGQVNGLRKRHAQLRARLQSKGTASAKRLLRKRRRKEFRFARDVNHSISKRLVAKAKDTGRGIVLEDLKGIRERITVRKAQRRVQHSWAFHQLGSFIGYKARLAVSRESPSRSSPRDTSRTCPVCSHVAKANRPTQASFLCVSCGFAGPADTIAADNIRRAVVNQPDAGAAYLGPPASPPALGVGS
jgi:IS605 OrfB family transposase